MVLETCTAEVLLGHGLVALDWAVAVALGSLVGIKEAPREVSQSL